MSLLDKYQSFTQAWTAGLAGQRLRMAGLLLLLSGLVVFGTAGALSPTAEPGIPQPEPGVNKTYNETFRILASNDPDPGFTTTTIEVPKYEGDGSVTVVNKTVGTFPVRLVSRELQGNFWSTKALEAAYMTDAYYTKLEGYQKIPYKDTWPSLASFRESGWGIDTRIIRLTNMSYGNATSTDGEFRVEVLHKKRFWLPVYRANVTETETETESSYTVANPSEAVVLDPRGQWHFQRKRAGLRALLRYSELAENEKQAREKAAIPMEDGEEVYPTTDGGTAPLVWRGSAVLVKDAYIGILDLERAAWYRGEYVTDGWEVTSRVPWDYRTEAPGNYSESASCTVEHTHTETHTHNNSTHTHTDTETHTYPKTNWADYRILTTEEEVNVTISNDTYSQQLYRGSGAGIWQTYDPSTDTHHSLSPGTYTLTANLTIKTTLRRHYGVSSEECSTWEKTDTVARTVTRTYSEPVRTVPNDARNLSINVTIYDKAGNDVVAINWSGDQRLEQNPWRQISIAIGNKSMDVESPWHFYSVTQNTAVEERSGSGTTAYNASHSYDGQYPALLRNRVSVANVTVRLSRSPGQRSWWRETHTVVADRIPSTPLPDTIIAPDNTGMTPLYDEYAGVYLSNDEAMNESVYVYADTAFGKLITNTSVNVVRYHNSTLDIWLEEQNGTERVGMRLTDAQTGAPLSNRTLNLTGMNRSTITTSANGTAYAEPTKTLVSARFSGDDWQITRSKYYASAHDGLATGFGFLSTANTVFGYIDVAISNVALVVEWVALGLFAYWWMRFRSPQRS